jgi:hypothetical protein
LGISWLELVLMVALCAVVLALALPGLRAAKISGNERAARRNLLSIAAAQKSWKAMVKVDQDADTVGEYGLLGELSGELIPRSGQGLIAPASIPPLVATGGGSGLDGCAVLDGYVYRIFLMATAQESGDSAAGDDLTLGGTTSRAGRSLTEVAAIEGQETYFILYAWPEAYGRTGKRAFVVTELNKTLATDMEKKTYSGRGPMGSSNVPCACAALTGKPFASSPAEATQGNDGNRWYSGESPPR